MVNRYELTLIVNPNESKESADIVIEKIVKAISDNEGKTIDKSTWGIKKFATPINKLDKGYYYFIQFDIEPANVDKVAWIYRFERAIIRYLLVNLTTDKTYFKQIELDKIRAKELKEMKRREIVAEASKGAQIDINMASPAREAAKMTKPVEKKEVPIEEKKVEPQTETTVEEKKADPQTESTDEKKDEVVEDKKED